MSQSEWVDRDYYADLGVSKDADQNEIRKAYRKLARESHPDSHPGDTAAEEKFKKVSTAYDVIGDEAKRKEYDEIRSLAASGGYGYGGRGGFGGHAGAGGAADFDVSDLFGAAGAAGGAGGAGGFGDIFGGLFNGGGRGASPGGRASNRGENIETSVTIGFRDAALGKPVEISFTAPSTCNTCSGSGARPGTSPRTCRTCQGAGYINRSQGPFGFSEPCPECGGAGTVIDDPCPECRGEGTTMRTRHFTVKIPAGIEDGKRIRLSGKGQAGFRGAPAGDLFVTVHVRQDKVFSRDGNDLLLDVPVSYPELVQGTKVSIPTLEGRVTVKVPENSKDGQVLRVRGRGIAPAKGATGALRATLRVAMPPKGAAEKELAAYAEALEASGFDPRSGWPGA
ncbi:DnaJ C-terminal domain-containing protein [Dietzia sp.]|uniref:DnaJ C-terminal domain-containing protein n=1 Tax=Dietzia sp. TaxID=1871616 RepID=UPI002FD94302